jgi:hypothetical protein
MAEDGTSSKNERMGMYNGGMNEFGGLFTANFVFLSSVCNSQSISRFIDKFRIFIARKIV